MKFHIKLYENAIETYILLKALYGNKYLWQVRVFKMFQLIHVRVAFHVNNGPKYWKFRYLIRYKRRL